jgi:hypothetical protein
MAPMQRLDRNLNVRATDGGYNLAMLSYSHCEALFAEAIFWFSKGSLR